jgi:hypothetical protein
MFAKIAVFSLLFISSVSAASLPVRRDASSTDAINTLRNMEIQYANDTAVVSQLETYVSDVVYGGNVTEIMASAQALVGSSNTSSNATTDNQLVYDNAVLQLQYYASSTVTQLQNAGKNDSVSALLDDINSLASQVADGSINMNDAYNATLQDMNSLTSPTNVKRYTPVTDLNSGLFQMELLTSNAISLFQVAGQSAVVDTFINTVNLLAADAQNGTISINDAVTETLMNIAMALTANITSTGTNTNATTNSTSS